VTISFWKSTLPHGVIQYHFIILS